jgi:hypothetical protein
MDIFLEVASKIKDEYEDGQAFTTHDVYMSLNADGIDTTEKEVKKALDRFAESLDINPARNLADGWYRMWDPEDCRSMVELASLQSTEELSETMKEVIRATVIHADDPTKPLVTSANPTATRRALRRRGLVKYRSYGDGDPRQSENYFRGALLRVLRERR